MNAKSLLVAAILSLSTVPAIAATAVPPAYDATYSVVDSRSGACTQHYMSNGTGRTRRETELNGHKTITIVDYPSRTAWTILEAQKMIAKGPWKGDATTDPGVQILDLGTSTQDGHVCTGQESSIEGGIRQMWSDKVTKVMVKTIFKGGGITRQTDMTSYTAGAPAASNFEIPTQGYTLVAKP